MGNWRRLSAGVVLLAMIGVGAGALPLAAAGSVGYFEAHTQMIDPGGSLETVSCAPGSATCIAADSGGVVFYTTTASVDSAATWSPWSGPTTGPSTALDCPTTTLCLLASGGGSSRVDHATSLGGAFSTSFLPASGVSAISCPSASFCLSAQEAGGFIRYSNDPTSISWTAEQVGTGAIRGASCLSASFCAAVDDSGHVHVATSEGDIENASGAGWVSTDVDGGAGLLGVACVSTSECLAVDGSGKCSTCRSPWVATRL